ncbi:MAG: hypothetical protein P4M08_06970 [Oligoflexia bacterium]|nr:hypothetical protein [Oligoflexia bacterium]
MKKAEALLNYIQYSETKDLLDRLLMLQENAKFKSVVVLSELSGEGKTFVTAALALAYTERLKKRVLVVDTATPRPAGAANPGRPSPDLLNELLERSETVDVISLRAWSGLKKGGDAAEYQLKALFSQVAAQYGLVLVDTSSLARKNRNNLDPSVIARQCDAAVLVSSKIEFAVNVSLENRKRMEASGIKLIGMIYNRGGAIDAAK